MQPSRFAAMLKLLRPHQYLKNGFVLLGPLFAHQWSADTLLPALLVFMAFCAIASAVYILNDILDLEADRQHPLKCKRPLASGVISIQLGQIFFVALAALSLGLTLFVSSWVTLFVCIYLLINVLYSLKLKHVVILDVFIISAGFMLRILAGTVGLEIEPSAWLLLCGLMVTLFLGFSKRRAELLMLESEGHNSNVTRKVLDDYSPAMLEQFITVTAACTILSYGMYTVSENTVAIHQSTDLIFTLPFVVYGIFRYLYLLHKKSRGTDTASDLLTDPHLLLTVSGWIGTVFWVLS